MPRKKIDTSNKPYISNYPPLNDWLHTLEARCDWQLPLGPKDEPHAYVEQWQAPGLRPFIVIVHANKNGWDIFTSCADGTIDATLADAMARLGMPYTSSPT